MQSFLAAIIISSSTSLLTAVSILLLLVVPIFFLVKKRAGSPKITLHGIENIPTNGGTIFVASQIRFDEQFALLNLPVKKILALDMSGLEGHPPQNTPLHKHLI